VLPLWGKNPILGPLRKQNTGMAAVRAGLLVVVVVVEYLYSASRSASN